jgi:uncharacterized membrane protein YkoI
MLAGVLAIGVAGCTCSAKHGEGKEKEDEKNEVKVTIDQLPPPVKATLDKESDGGKFGDIDKEMKDGKVVYEADVAAGDKSYEIQIAEDGTLLKKKLEKPEDEKKEEGEKDGK